LLKQGVLLPSNSIEIDQRKQSKIMNKEIERPLKDKLALQRPGHGYLSAEISHFKTSIFGVDPKEEGDDEMKDLQGRRTPGRYAFCGVSFQPGRNGLNHQKWHKSYLHQQVKVKLVFKALNKSQDCTVL
jgi:hypothetical protein